MDPLRWQLINRIFHSALEVPSSERAAFVVAKSNGDPEICAQVKHLLAADEQAESYLESPIFASEVFNSSCPSHFEEGTILCDRFVIVQQVGEGGMGRVYAAHDKELGVTVALKVLRPEISAHPESLTRFRQEVRLARRITHPNICRIYDLNRDAILDVHGHRGEVFFLTMEFLVGETLAARIQRDGAIPDDEAHSIAVQLAAGLEAAHSLGVIHRDIKPANIYLVSEPGASSRSLRAVITDFGLARLDPLESGEISASAGLLRPVGTLSYMAPEQLEGKPVSRATDIYSFGLVLFEMVTGARAFPSSNLLDGIAQRLSGTLPSPKAILSSLSPEWQRAIQGCLRRDAMDRFQSASDVIAAVSGRMDYMPIQGNGATRISEGTPPVSVTSPNRRLLRFVSLGLLGVSLFIGVLRFYKSERDSKIAAGTLVYLTPVRNQTGERALDNMTELLRTELSQSAHINLLDQGRVGDTLQLMAKPPETVVSPPIAREIAMRTGAIRVILATISSSNGRYSFDVDIQQPDSSPSSVRDSWHKSFSWGLVNSSDAPNRISGELLKAVRDSSDWIRNKVGESADDVARLSAPPEDVTTSNWQALAAYSLAMKLHADGQTEDAVESLEEAVRYDPQFALAFGRLGDLQVMLGRYAEGYTSYERALDTGDRLRLTRREQDRIKGLFASDTGDYGAAEASFRDYSLYYPSDYLGWFYRGFPLMMLGRTEEATEMLRRSFRLDPSKASPPTQLGIFDGALDNSAEARAMADHLAQTGYPIQSHMVLGITAFMDHHFDDAIKEFQAISSNAARDPSGQSWALAMMARVFAEQGDYRSSIETLNEGIHVSLERGDEAERASKLLDRAYLECRLGEFAAVDADIEEALNAERSPKSQILAAAIFGQAMVSAPTKTLMRIRRSLIKAEEGSSADNFGNISKLAHVVLHGYLLLADRRWLEAVVEFRKASVLDAPGRPQAYLPQALTMAAAHISDRRQAQVFRIEALHLFSRIALHPYLVWASPKSNLPGYWADQISCELQVAEESGNNDGEIRLARSIYSQLRGANQRNLGYPNSLRINQ